MISKQGATGIALILVLLAAGYMMVGCDGSGQSEEVDNATYAPVYVAVAKGRVDIEGGVIRLAAQRDGIIQQVFVEEGAQVTRDQILAVQDTRDAKIQVQLAEARVEEARARYELSREQAEFAEREANRNEGAVKEGAVSKQVADEKQTASLTARATEAQAEAALAIAQAELERAKFEIEVRNIRAPFDGRIVKRNANPGAGLSTLNVTELFQLAPNAQRIVRAEVDEQFIDNVKVGMIAEIVSETNPDKVWQGKVIRIGEVFGSRKDNDDPQARQDVRVVDTVLSIDDNTARIGQRVLVKIEKPSQ